MPRLARSRLERGIPAERPRLQAWAQDAAWEAEVDQPMEPALAQILRQSIVRGTPYGTENWVQELVTKQGLETKVRSRVRPRKHLYTPG